MPYYTIVNKTTRKPYECEGRLKGRCILYTSDKKLQAEWDDIPDKKTHEIAELFLSVINKEVKPKPIVKLEKTGKLVIPPKCPNCKEMMVKRSNKTTGDGFWGCSNYPDCKGTREIKSSKLSECKRGYSDRVDYDYDDNDSHFEG
jgi:hypothetical protein